MVLFQAMCWLIKGSLCVRVRAYKNLTLNSLTVTDIKIIQNSSVLDFSFYSLYIAITVLHTMSMASTMIG